MKKVLYAFMSISMVLCLCSHGMESKAKDLRICDGCDITTPVTHNHYVDFYTLGLRIVETTVHDFEFDYSLSTKVSYEDGKITSVSSPTITFGNIFRSETLDVSVSIAGTNFSYSVNSAKSKATVTYKIRFLIDGYYSNWLTFVYDVY